MNTDAEGKCVGPFIIACIILAPYAEAGLAYGTAALTTYMLAHTTGELLGTYTSEAPQEDKQQMYEATAINFGAGISIQSALVGTSLYGGGKVANTEVRVGKLTKREQLRVNAEQGNAFRDETYEKIKAQYPSAQKEISVKTNSGVRTKTDIMYMDEFNNINIVETKRTQTSQFTKNQKIAFPQIQQSGGIIVGKGKGIFTGGTKVSNTTPQIIRKY